MSISWLYITPEIRYDPDWRNKARRWLPARSVQPGPSAFGQCCTVSGRRTFVPIRAGEFLYRALKGRKISFAPLPVFVRGGELRRRVEPDFVILYRGRVLVVGLDGKHFHHETSAEAHERLNFST